MIKSTYNKGFQMTFDNGLSISVQFGAGNYSSNRDLSKPSGVEMKKAVTEATSAELAIWDENNVDFHFKEGLNKGWVQSDEVAIWIAKVQRAKDIKSLRK